VSSNKYEAVEKEIDHSVFFREGSSVSCFDFSMYIFR
jgi:hypothetical protein